MKKVIVMSPIFIISFPPDDASPAIGIDIAAIVFIEPRVLSDRQLNKQAISRGTNKGISRVSKGEMATTMRANCNCCRVGLTYLI